MELAFKKSVEEGTARDKDAIKAAMFGKKREIRFAPKEGKVPRDKIQAAVKSVSKQHDANESETPVPNV